MTYAELQVTSNFSFLQGASHPEELMEQAAGLGLQQIAITDENSFAGLVRGHMAAKKSGLRFIPGVRLQLLDGAGLLAYPTDKNAYSRLSALLTKGNLRTEKGNCHLYKQDVYEHAEGSEFIVIPPCCLNERFDFADSFKNLLNEYKQSLGEHLYLAATRHYLGDDSKQLHRISQLSSSFDIPMVATNNVFYHHPDRRQLQDVLTCIREKCTIQTAGFRLHPNAERHLKPAQEMIRLFRQYPEAIRNTEKIAGLCRFSLDSLQYEYPREITTDGRTPQEELCYRVWICAKERFGENIPEKITQNIHYELSFIEQMNYAAYFLTVYDLVRFARERGILCQGRGSAANSTVCYCLGITSVDPTKFDLLFERFISSARNEPPDIDVDFEHERREEVIQYIYEKYGRDRAAIVATVTCQHLKGAIRDVGKVMGLSIDTINHLSGSAWFTDEQFGESQLAEQGLNPHDQHLQKTLMLTKEFMGFPRQLGQHTGGFVITESKLSDLCPILNARMENRTCIEWDKNDIDALGFLKIDVLALGMLTCIRKAFDLAKEHYDLDLTLANIPQDDKAVYDMICKADTIGVFQIESRAQQAMLPLLKPRNFYDLVIEVAIVRPGPILGDMVHPYLRRRNGEEPVDYPSKELEEILGRTLGIPLFQEQAMKIAIVAAGFSPTEADALRRSMATFKLQGMVSKFQEKLTSGMKRNGYSAEYAQRVFRQLEGFGSYGFPESHAASFALLVYVSSWIKCYYPDVFACALLNSLPMGFYQPAQIVDDAKKHGVELRPVDINFSNWDNRLEERSGSYCALRLGFRQINGLREEDVKVLIAARENNYSGVTALRDTGLSKSALEKLADADAFRSIGLDRRAALWEISTMDHPEALFKGKKTEEEAVDLPQMTLPQHVVQDYQSLSLSLKAHPVSFLRSKLDQLHVVPAKKLMEYKDGMMIKVAGLVLVRQRPETAKGVCFMTIEDEGGFVNLVIFQNLFEKYKKQVLQSKLIMVEGRLQREGDVIHVIASCCHDLTKWLRVLHRPENVATKIPTLEFNQKNDVKKDVFPGSRNFR
ncbi:MAG: error-prone DNA polymerase [Flavisolibacter sp.]